MAKDNNTYKPGMTVPKSGQYAMYGPRGGDKGVEVTSVKGEPFPPTLAPGCYYMLADATKHKK